MFVTTAGVTSPVCAREVHMYSQTQGSSGPYGRGRPESPLAPTQTTVPVLLYKPLRRSSVSQNDQ